MLNKKLHGKKKKIACVQLYFSFYKVSLKFTERLGSLVAVFWQIYRPCHEKEFLCREQGPSPVRKREVF